MTGRENFLKSVRLLAIFIAVFSLILPVGVDASTLSELLSKQEELKRQERENQAALEQKRREADSLNSAISNIDDDIAYTNSRIANTQAQINTTNQVIAALEQKITTSKQELAELNEKLNSAYVSLYELSQTSTMELILQSNSLDEIVSQTQYIQAIQTDLQDDIAKQEEIKTQLEKDKSEADKQKEGLVELNGQLSASRNSLNSQRAQKDYLLDVTQGQQAAYERLLAQIRSEASQISADIYAARLAAGGFVGGGGTGGYPYASSCDQVDPWLYYTCQCTSYAAWKFKVIHGVPFKNTQPGRGSARYWPELAAHPDNDFTVSSSPKVGDVVSWYGPLFPGDIWGHVAIVETVYSSTDIVVSEYNWSPAKKYSVRRINPNAYGTPRYIRP